MLFEASSGQISAQARLPSICWTLLGCTYVLSCHQVPGSAQDSHGWHLHQLPHGRLLQHEAAERANLMSSVGQLLRCVNAQQLYNNNNSCPELVGSPCCGSPACSSHHACYHDMR